MSAEFYNRYASSLSKTQALLAAFIIIATLLLLYFFEVTEGWRLPIVFAVGITYLGATHVRGFQSVCNQVHVSSEFIIETIGKST